MLKGVASATAAGGSTAAGAAGPSSSSEPGHLLVYWPDGLEPFDATAMQTVKRNTSTARFLIGWNPRGTVVCVADIVHAPCAEDAAAEMRRLKQSHPDIIPGLRLLGRIHPPSASGGPVVFPHDDGARARRTGELWVELVDGPALADLYVCGIRVPAQLFVTHYDMAKQYSVDASRLTAVSRLGYTGVKRTLAAERATTLSRGTISRVEGAFLPSHRANLDVLRRTAPETRPPPVTNHSLTEYHLHGSTGSLESSPQHDPSLDNASVATAEGGSTNDSLLHFVHGTEAHADWSPERIDPATPPRLSFPTWSTTTELSTFMRCINQAREIRLAARNPDYVPYMQDGSAAGHATIRKVADLARRALLPILVVITMLARVSYVFSIIEFKLREFLCALSIITRRASACGLHAFIPHSFIDEGPQPVGDAPPGANTERRRVERHHCLWSFATRSIVDFLLGFFLTAELVRHSEHISGCIRELAWWGIHDLHIGYLEWFHGWPAGFKLNDELNEVMLLICRAIFSVWSTIVHEGDIDWMSVAMVLWGLTGCIGLSFSIAFVADVCNLITLHIRFLLHLMSFPYRAVRAIVASLMLQFRGKRRNALRNRVDEWIYGADEMILGMLIGTITLFVAPTVAMYYFYFATARTTIWVLQETLRGVATILCYLPVYPLVLVITRPSQLPNGVAFDKVRVRTSNIVSMHSAPSSPTFPTTPPATPMWAGTVVEADLQPRRMPVSEAVAEFAVVVRFVVESALNPGRIMRFVFEAHEKPILDLRGSVFAHLCQDPSRPVLPRKQA